MKQGYFFSIEATLGIAVLLIAITTIGFYYSNLPRETIIQHALEKNATDAATVGFYMADKTTQDFGLQGTIQSTAKQGYCANYFKYTPIKDSGHATPVEQKFCDSK